MTADAVRGTGCQCILGNTYHLMLRPGADRIAGLGGLHRFVDWPGPILTDSGGFQIMSLFALRTIDADGVTFQSHIDGSRYRLTPAICMDLQDKFDSTISMVLDECVAFPATHAAAMSSMDMSMRWAELSKRAFRPRPGYGVFGIIHGSTYPDLRLRSVNILKDIGFDGFAIGGLAVGEGQQVMLETLEITVPHLPKEIPRYLMGVGTPDDMLKAVERGIDMFDCVIPTRSGRTAAPIRLQVSKTCVTPVSRSDSGPLDMSCECPACTKHSRAYLHYLFRAGEMLGPMLLTWHNLAYYQSLMRDIRSAIQGRTSLQPRSDIRASWVTQGTLR